MFEKMKRRLGMKAWVMVALLLVSCMQSMTLVHAGSGNNGYYVINDETIVTTYVEGGSIAYIEVDAVDAASVQGISYDKAKNILTLDNFTASHLSVYKENVTVYIKGVNAITKSGDCLCVDAPFTIEADDNATLTCADIADASVDSFFHTITLGDGVTRTGNVFTGRVTAEDKNIDSEQILVKKGGAFESSGLNFKVTKSSLTAGSVDVVSAVKKTTMQIAIPDEVEFQNVTYKVTGIANKAFAKYGKLKKATIGANVTKIGKSVFTGDKNLKSLIIKAQKLKSVGKYSFKNVHSKIVVKLPKSNFKAMKKLFATAGLPKKARFTK